MSRQTVTERVRNERTNENTFRTRSIAFSVPNAFCDRSCNLCRSHGFQFNNGGYKEIYKTVIHTEIFSKITNKIFYSKVRVNK